MAGDQLHPRAVVAPETLSVAAALARRVKALPSVLAWEGCI